MKRQPNPLFLLVGNMIRPCIIDSYLILLCYNHGCHDGSILQRLSWLLAAVTNVLTLLSMPSKCASEFNREMIAVTAWVTIFIRSSPFKSVGVCDMLSVSSCLLCSAITSSRRIARSMACSWYEGCTKQRAVAIALAVKGPVTPVND